MASCQHCHKTFGRIQSLTRHLREKHGDPHRRKIECSYCIKTFARAEHYRRHLQTQHNNALPIYPCPFCANKSFKRLDSLTQHLKNCPVLAKQSVELVENHQPIQDTQPVHVTVIVEGAEPVDQTHLFCTRQSHFTSSVSCNKRPT